MPNFSELTSLRGLCERWKYCDSTAIINREHICYVVWRKWVIWRDKQSHAVRRSDHQYSSFNKTLSGRKISFKPGKFRIFLLNPRQFSVLFSLLTINFIPLKLSISLHEHHMNATGHQQVTCLCLLGLSAAFDTTDHVIIFDRLCAWFGIDGTALNWFKSCPSHRLFCVKCSHDLPESHERCYSVPEASVLGPFLFTLYTALLSSLIPSLSLLHNHLSLAQSHLQEFDHSVIGSHWRRSCWWMWQICAAP